MTQADDMYVPPTWLVNMTTANYAIVDAATRLLQIPTCPPAESHIVKAVIALNKALLELNDAYWHLGNHVCKLVEPDAVTLGNES